MYKKKRLKNGHHWLSNKNHLRSITVEYPRGVAVCQIFFYKQVYSIIVFVVRLSFFLDLTSTPFVHSHPRLSICMLIGSWFLRLSISPRPFCTSPNSTSMDLPLCTLPFLCISQMYVYRCAYYISKFYVYRSVPVASVHAPPLSPSRLCKLPSVPVASLYAPLMRLFICASSTHKFIDLLSLFQYNHCSYVYWSVPIVFMLTSLLHLLICPCHVWPPPHSLLIHLLICPCHFCEPSASLSSWPCHLCVPSTSRSISTHFCWLRTSMSIDLSLSYHFCMLPQSVFIISVS